VKDLLQQAPALRSLHISDCPILKEDTLGLPACLVSRQGLASLHLHSCSLETLPPGPYLESE